MKHDGGTPVKGKRRKIIYKKSSSSFTDVMDNGVYSVNVSLVLISPFSFYYIIFIGLIQDI